MPTIDTSTIEGFDTMTPEQKVEALTKVEIPESVDLSGYVKKDLFDKTSSELAEAKKAIKGKMTKDEAAKAQADADMKDLKDKYDELLKKSTIAENKANYLGMPGYDDKLAQEAAEALFDGDMGKVFEIQKKANEAYEKAMKAELLKGTPNPGGNGGKEKEEYDNIAMARQMGKAKAEAMKSADNIFGKYKI